MAIAVATTRPESFPRSPRSLTRGIDVKLNTRIWLRNHCNWIASLYRYYPTLGLTVAKPAGNRASIGDFCGETSNDDRRSVFQTNGTFGAKADMERRLASLECHHPKAINRGAAAVGKGLATP
jgi:hypothetical protein